MGGVLVPAAVFTAALSWFLCMPNRQYSWDVLERSYLLAHWADAPSSHRFYWAHLAELPLARVLDVWLRTPERPAAGLQALESLAAAGLFAFVTRLGWASSGQALHGLAGAIALAGSLALWWLGAGGEERVVATLALCLAATLWTASERGESPRVWWVVGVAFGTAVVVHLANVVLFLWLSLLAAVRWFARDQPTANRSYFARVLVVLSTGAVVVGVSYAVSTPIDLTRLLSYHRPLVDARHSVFSSGIGLAAVVSENAVVAVVVWLGLIVSHGFVAVVARRHGQLAPRTFDLWMLGVLWCLHFAFFEPENRESWLALYVGAVALLVWRSGPLVAVRVWIGGCLATLGLVAIVANIPTITRASTASGLETWVRAFEQHAPAGSVLVTSEGLEARAFRALSSNIRVVTIDELYPGAVGDAYAGPSASRADVNAWIAAGVAVYCHGFTPERMHGFRFTLAKIATHRGFDILRFVSPIEPAAE